MPNWNAYSISQPTNVDRKLKHLEFIQGVINRLSTNSFLLKGWSVVLASGLFALSAHNSDATFVMLAYIPAFVFWGLDGYFLWQEWIYRKLYDRVRVTEPDNIDFSMDTRDVVKEVKGWSNATLSKTLVPFHGALVAAIVVVMFVQLLRS